MQEFFFRNLVLLGFRELSCDTVSTVLANARKQGKTLIAVVKLLNNG